MKVLLVGASGRIGSAIADALRSAGYHVVPTWHSRSIVAGERLDLAFDDMAEWVSVRQLQLSNLDGVVVASGVNEPGRAETVTLDGWERIFAVNLRGPFFLLRALWPHLALNSSVVLIGSISGQIGGPITPHYAAAKAGLTALTKHFSMEGGPLGIRVNCVAPGWIDSEMSLHMPDWPIPMGRKGTPQEVAAIVEFLLSGRSSYITGQTIGVNGGAHLGD